MNFAIIPAVFNCLRKGEAVANPAAWKVGGEALKAALATFILSLQPVAEGFGYDLHITPAISGSVAAAVVWLVGLFFTAATSKTIGLLPAKPGNGAPGDGAAAGDAHPAAQVGGEPAQPAAADPVRLQPGAPDNPNNYLPG